MGILACPMIFMLKLWYFLMFPYWNPPTSYSTTVVLAVPCYAFYPDLAPSLMGLDLSSSFASSWNPWTSYWFPMGVLDFSITVILEGCYVLLFSHWNHDISYNTAIVLAVPCHAFYHELAANLMRLGMSSSVASYWNPLLSYCCFMGFPFVIIEVLAFPLVMLLCWLRLAMHSTTSLLPAWWGWVCLLPLLLPPI